MGLFNRQKVAETTLVDPKKAFANLLKATSGAGYSRSIKYNIFYRVIGFKGSSIGVGCSTIVANTALALADLGLTVCVMDTSIQHPVQDALLKTDYKDASRNNRLDWFDMPFTSKSVLNVSSFNSNISVLSFNGKNRTVLDALSTKDNKALIDDALDKLQDKFDIMLIDLCDELTRVNIFGLQKAQHIIQVWDDSISNLESLDTTITNLVTLSCPMDKMRYVVENKTIDDNMGNLDALLKQYRFKKLGHCGLSYEVARQSALGRRLWQSPSNDDGVIQFTECIINIVKHICNITDDDNFKGTVTSQDIEDGKVEGTLHKKMKDDYDASPKVEVSTPNLGGSDSDLFDDTIGGDEDDFDMFDALSESSDASIDDFDSDLLEEVKPKKKGLRKRKGVKSND